MDRASPGNLRPPRGRFRAGEEQVVQRVPRPGPHAGGQDGRADRPGVRGSPGGSDLPGLSRDRPDPRPDRQRQLQHRGRPGGSVPVRRGSVRQLGRVSARRGAEGEADRAQAPDVAAVLPLRGVLRHLSQGEPHRARQRVSLAAGPGRVRRLARQRDLAQRFENVLSAPGRPRVPGLPHAARARDPGRSGGEGRVCPFPPLPGREHGAPVPP